jgi:hypothetical protein
MGEARRRKLAGHDPIASARRLASGPPGPVEAFRVPDGCVALTFDVEGVAPSTCIMDPTNLSVTLEAMDGLMRAKSYVSMVRGVAAEFRAAKRTGRDKSLSSLGLMGLWLAFNHPNSGEVMRERVSDALRREGKAHITMSFGAAGLCFALGSRFMDARRLIEAAPPDMRAVYVADREPP